MGLTTVELGLPALVRLALQAAAASFVAVGVADDYCFPT